MRTGLLAEKVGMSRFYNEEGQHLPVTILKVAGCQVTEVRTQDKNGYTAVQLGIGQKRLKSIKKPLRGQFAKAKVEPKARLVEFRVSPENLLSIGDELSAEHFLVGQKVDVSGVTHGKGFAGVIKRWNFGGQRQTHGALKTHRQMGSTGQCQDPGRVFKNKKMPGQLGNVRQTIQGLEIVATDAEKGWVIVKGALPGAKGSFVEIKDSVKYAAPKDLPFPAALKQAANKAAAEAEEAPKAETAEAPKADAAPQEAAPAPAEAPKVEAAPAADAPAEAKDENKE